MTDTRGLQVAPVVATRLRQDKRQSCVRFPA
jgi:hypothetical protein